MQKGNLSRHLSFRLACPISKHRTWLSKAQAAFSSRSLQTNALTQFIHRTCRHIGSGNSLFDLPPAILVGDSFYRFSVYLPKTFDFLHLSYKIIHQVLLLHLYHLSNRPPHVAISWKENQISLTDSQN